MQIPLHQSAFIVFFFSSRRRHTRFDCDWSSDVCSSDLQRRVQLAGFRQLDPALEEAAASLGAGRWAAFRRVTLPLLRPALAAGASLAFVAALGDFVTAIVLYTYDNRPISIEIMSSLRLSELGVAAAFGVILMGLSALVLALGARR